MPQQSLLPIVNGKVRRDMRCVACELAQSPDLVTNCMYGSGASEPTYFFVGHAPGFEDDRNREPMTGKNGKLLRQLLSHAGISISDCFFTNTLKCCPHGVNLKETHFKQCRDYLIDEIKEHKPTVIISTGAQAMTWLTGYKGVSKLRRRGIPCSLPVGKDVLVFPMRQPASLFHAEGEEYFKLFDELVSDLVWIRQQVEHGIVHRAGDIETDHQVARSEDDIDRFFAEFEEVDCLACDLETGDINFEPRLYPGKDCRIISVGFSTKAGHARAIPMYAPGITSALYWPDGFIEKVIHPKLKKLFEDKEVFGSNFVSFDQKWIRYELGVQNCNITYDVMLGHYILNEERGTHGLETLATVFTTMSPWKSTFTLKDTERMCKYLCRDVDATFRLREVLEPQLNDIQRWLLDTIILPVSNTLLDVEYTGVSVDMDNLVGLNELLIAEVEDEKKKLQKSSAVQAFEISENVNFNPESPKQVAAVLGKYKKLSLPPTASGELSVSAPALADYTDVEEVQSVLRIRKLNKLRSTYCEGLINAADENNLVHTSYKVHGTVTGRLASENPNLQNMPRKDTVGKVLTDGTVIKAVFAAKPGYCLLQADYSQIELRVLACLSGDERMLDVYRKGQDLHTFTAASVCGIPIEDVTDAIRTGGKKVSFGIVYGMSLESLISVFVSEGNTEQAAREFIDGHKQTFPDVWRYMDEQEYLIRTQRFQETHFGRRRRYQNVTPAEVRMGYNYPIQSTASDFTLLSIISCNRVLKKLGLDAKIVLTVYDSIIFEVRNEHFWEVCAVVKQLMEGLKFDWLTVPLVVDLEVGQNWGKMQKVDMIKKIVY